MPRLSRDKVAEREGLAVKLFKEGKGFDTVQAELVKLDGMKMAPPRLLELEASVKADKEFKPPEPKPLKAASQPSFERVIRYREGDPMIEEAKAAGLKYEIVSDKALEDGIKADASYSPALNMSTIRKPTARILPTLAPSDSPQVKACSHSKATLYGKDVYVCLLCRGRITIDHKTFEAR